MIRKLSDDGFYPRLGGLNAGSGLAGGGGYRRHFTQIFTDVSGAISTKVYLGVDAKVRWLQTAGKTFEVWTDYQFRDDTKDPFYGIGLQSPPAASTDYAIRTNDAVARAVVHVRSWLSAGAGIGYFAPAVRRGRDSRIRSIEQVFTDTNAPGLAQQPKYIHDNVFAEIDLRDTTGSPRRGGLYRTTYELWNDGTFDQYDFRRLEVDASHFFAVTESDVVALHLGLAYTNNAPGSRVPFYLLPFLGGGDTLRAYREFRFRDENAGVFNAEVRHHLNTLVHIAGFVDAGKVAHDWQDINPTDLKMSYGFGVRAATASRMFLRCDTAFGGHEGPRVFVKFTPAF
ncbi:MAG TPA: BamA/TamA family outer membrane protein [Vicinamibacterales bacterium]